MVFVGIPFVVRTVQPVLAKLDSEYEEVAYVLGAGRFTTFRRVIIPEITPALLSGFGLAFARGLGEYGSVIYISGNSARKKTQVVSYVIMQKLNYMDYDGAAAVALVTLVISFLVLTLVNIVQIRQSRRTNEL
jgi:sulfate transport system permease protein